MSTGIDMMNIHHRPRILELHDDPEWSGLKKVDPNFKLAKRKTRTYFRGSTTSYAPGTVLKPGD